MLGLVTFREGKMPNVSKEFVSVGFFKQNNAYLSLDCFQI